LSKSVLGVHCDRVIPPLKYDNCFISEDSAKAETFNQYFAKQMSISNNIADLPTLPPFSHITDERLSSVDVNKADVLRYLRQVNMHKYYGPDGISNHILKFCAALTKLLNFSLLNGKYLSQWKISNVCPVYKQKGDKRDISNYRPIALLSTKIFEKVIYKSLYEFCVLHNVLISENSGFKKNYSTVNQLIAFTHKIYKAIDFGHDVCAIFLDVSKAFDKVWHEGLIFKLKQIGICDNLLLILINYLDSWSQKVVLNGTSSSLCSSSARVPKGLY
jgi:hypothetical protein